MEKSKGEMNDYRKNVGEGGGERRKKKRKNKGRLESLKFMVPSITNLRKEVKR